MDSEPDQQPPRAPLGGQLAWWPFALALGGVAVVVIAVILVNTLAGSGTTGSRQQGTGLTASGAVACPEFYEHAHRGWVPARPAGVRSPTRIVPTLHPTHVTVCEYLGRPGGAATSLQLTGQRELTGDLDRVVDTLRTVPKAATTPPACAAPAGVQDANDYLIGMRYAEAIVWVSAPGNHCVGSGNGVFHSDRNLAVIAADSFATRTWVSSP